MEYQSSQTPHPAQRNFDPYALVHRWGWWYVIGFCHRRKEVRTFRVDRIAGISLLESTFEIEKDFDLQAILKQEIQAQPAVQARIRFQPEFAGLAVWNRSYWATIDRQADGSVIVTFSAPTLEWAASTALAYGPIAEVLEPPELRLLVSDWARLTAQIYAGQGKPE